MVVYVTELEVNLVLRNGSVLLDCDAFGNV